MATRAKKAARREKRKAQRQANDWIEASNLDGETDIVFAAAEIEIEDGEDETSPPSMNVVAYTGDRLSLPNFPMPAVINCENVRAMDSDQLPFLRDHKVGRPLGHGKPEITATNLKHDGSLSQVNADRKEVIEANANGFRWQASVGGRIPNIKRDVQTIKAGQMARVNGRVFQGPVAVINAFLWKETSVTAVGADEGRASAAIAASHHRVIPMNEFEKWLEDQGIDSANLTAGQTANLKAAWDAMQSADGSNVAASGQGDGQASVIDTDSIVAAATRAAVEASQAQSQRDRRIDRLFANYSDTSLTSEQVDQLRAQVEGGEITEDRAHLQLIQASRARGGTSSVNSGGGSHSPQRNAEIVASLGQHAGLTEEQSHEMLVEAGLSDDQAEAAVSRGSRRYGLKSLIRAVCNQENHHVDEVDDEAIGVAIKASQRDFNPANVMAASGGFSTVSVVGILSRLANKAMLAAYAEADAGGVALQISSTTSTNDFKKFTRYRMTEAGVMEEVTATGEIPHGTLTEEEYENQVKTYGKMFALSRQMIRNDDLDAFLQIPRMIGRMGRHGLEQATLTVLNSAAVGTNTGFFQSTGDPATNRQPNYLAGANTNLSFDALDAAYPLFLNQTDTDGKPIGIDPELLLCTNYDIVQARKLYNDVEYRFTAADTTETINNQWKGMFQPLKSSYLHRVGGGTQLQWYLFSRPTTDIAALQIAFLDGIQTPTINQAETSFNTLGIQMRGYFDWGVALQDHRAAVKIKGEA